MNDQNYDDLEKLLNEISPVADQKFYLTLRQKVLNISSSQKSPAQPKVSLFSRFSLWQPVAVAALFLILLLFLTPIGQAWAQQIFRVGTFFVTNNLTLAEQWLNNSQPEVETYTLDTVSTGIDEASDVAGFVVYYPSYLPLNYHPESDTPVKLVLGTEGEIMAAEAMFNSIDGEHFLFYAQHPFPPDAELSSIPLDIGEAAVEVVTVQGNEALWLTDYVWGTVRDETGGLQPEEYNVLVWTFPASNGAKYYFWLGSNEKLSQTEMLRIADSFMVQ